MPYKDQILAAKKSKERMTKMRQGVTTGVTSEGVTTGVTRMVPAPGGGTKVYNPLTDGMDGWRMIVMDGVKRYVFQENFKARTRCYGPARAILSYYDGWTPNLTLEDIKEGIR